MQFKFPIFSDKKQDLLTDIYSVLFVMVCFVLLVFFLYGPSGDDDSYITYAAAKYFSETGKILNNNGNFVEQGSSLLHVVMLGSLSYLTEIETVKIGYLFSLFFAVICIPLVFFYSRNLGITRPIYSSVLLSLSVSFAYWSSGGLEGSMFSVVSILLCCHVVFLIKRNGIIFFDLSLWFLSLLFLTSRPESLFVILSSLVGLAVVPSDNVSNKLRSILVITSVIVIISLFVFVCRFYYFDSIFPQPVYAKLSPLTFQKILYGFGYFIYSMQVSVIIFTLVLLCVGFMLLFRIKKYPLDISILVSFSFSYLSFIVLSGGDWMSGGRFFSPVIPFLIIPFVFVVQKSLRAKYLFILMIVLMAIESIFFSLKVSSGIPLYKENYINEGVSESARKKYSYSEINNIVHLRDIPLIDALSDVVYKKIKKENKYLNILSIQMGMQPYHLRKEFGSLVRFIDLRGLTTRHSTDCALFDNIERRWTGVFITYTDYFKAMKSCHLPEPDIIYDLLNRSEADNATRLTTIRQAGYKVVYKQSGEITVFNGVQRLSKDAFIAIKVNS